ncbi:aldose 1-epimerase [Neisseria leonii]|uniref:aldose 1-epimerase n=1 Tax=Neisseria leonii TaxID=2995413 RepID=UPI00237A550B|nr:aldose 1-epimerase [Neisseria sp. 3986]MDD9325070.1 aldose 1-epimerase [Neisseria sp. 3986]
MAHRRLIHYDYVFTTIRAMFQTESRSDGIILHSSALRAEILPFGALLNRLEIRLPEGGSHNFVAAFDHAQDAAERITQGFRSAKLSPFVCRLNQGRYTFQGRSFETGKHRLDGHAIHGLLYDAPFSLIAEGADGQSAWCELAYDYRGSLPGYPFPYRLTVRYTLRSDGLHVHTAAENTGSTPLPLADGWHPYFRLDGVLDEWTLQLAGSRKLVFDAALLPTGGEETDTRFLTPQPLAGIGLDNSFLPDRGYAAAVLRSRRLELAVDAEENYPLLQIYIPPERDCIALENLSGAPDCFNNGIGLYTLAAGETRRFCLRYRPSVRTDNQKAV